MGRNGGQKMLSMTLPYRHPKTGMWWVRKTVPQALRAAVGRRELKKSLGTKGLLINKRIALSVF